MTEQISISVDENAVIIITSKLYAAVQERFEKTAFSKGVPSRVEGGTANVQTNDSSDWKRGIVIQGPLHGRRGHHVANDS